MLYLLVTQLPLANTTKGLLFKFPKPRPGQNGRVGGTVFRVHEYGVQYAPRVMEG